MELWLTLRFRGGPLALRHRLPPGLAFLARYLRSLDGPEVPPNDRISTAYVQVTPEQADDIVAWGGLRTIDGLTILASATFEARWRARELAREAVVELVRAPAVDPPPVVGRSRSHVARWACSHCDRIHWEQVGPLDLAVDGPAEVELVHRARPELLLTAAGELIAGSRLRPIFEAHGLGTRPVLGSRAWVQVVEAQQVVSLAAVPPLESHGPACRGCARESLVRGDGPELSSGVRILRMIPWTIAGRLPPGVALGSSEECIRFMGAVHDQPVHPMGGPVDLESQPVLFGLQGAPVILATPALACALAEAQAGGLEVRPVRTSPVAVTELSACSQ
jgi:hypothetical protein